MMKEGRPSGAPNEVWSYGEAVYGLLRVLLALREHLRPYIHAQMRIAERTGLPPMRPLFLSFPKDAACWMVEDQFLLGDDLLVAPVTEEGRRERSVYLPAGATWQDAWTGETEPGGRYVLCAAALGRTPAFVRQGGALLPWGSSLLEEGR